MCELTGGSEKNIVDVVVEGGDSLHDDLCVVDIFGGEARPLANGQHGVGHERVVLHKLQCLVGQQQGVGDVLHAVQVVNALWKSRTGELGPAVKTQSIDINERDYEHFSTATGTVT